MLQILQANTTQNLEFARALFKEYTASLDFDLDFQNFKEELANLPGDYAPPGGHLLIGEVLGVMKKLAEEGMTMLVVTHEMGFAREVADRIIFLGGGKIIEEGPPDQLMNDPKQEITRSFLSHIL